MSRSGQIREKNDKLRTIIESINIIKLSRLVAALYEVLSNPIISIKQKSSSSPTITTANGSISG